MRSKDELTSLFTAYFSDRLSPTQIDTLVADVMAGIQNRRARTYAGMQVFASGSQPAQVLSAEFA
jgi:hypothetical protein